MRTLELNYGDEAFVVDYIYREGMKGDGYLTPDDPPDIRVVEVWKMDDNSPELIDPDLEMTMYINEQIREYEQ